MKQLMQRPHVPSVLTMLVIFLVVLVIYHVTLGRRRAN